MPEMGMPVQALLARCWLWFTTSWQKFNSSAGVMSAMASWVRQAQITTSGSELVER
jgi:hypothetical protein